MEVVRPERLVYDHVSGPVFRATVTFADEGQNMRLTMQMLFATTELRDKVAQEFGVVEGLSQTLGRLEEEWRSNEARRLGLGAHRIAARRRLYSASISSLAT